MNNTLEHLKIIASVLLLIVMLLTTYSIRLLNEDMREVRRAELDLEFEVLKLKQDIWNLEYRR